MKPASNKTPDVPALRRAAMDYLARREHSYHELQQKLVKRFPHSEHDLITLTIDRLREENLQSDDRFAEAYVRYRRTRGFGPRHIEQELRLRRTKEQCIQSQLYSGEDIWFTAARDQLSKRLRPLGKGTFFYRSSREAGLDMPTRTKLTRQLLGRGFTHEQIDYAFKELIERQPNR